jgi:hypothetical protein
MRWDNSCMLAEVTVAVDRREDVISVNTSFAVAGKLFPGRAVVGQDEKCHGPKEDGDGNHGGDGLTINACRHRRGFLPR